MQLHDYRREYIKDGLRRRQLNSDPILQFEQWLQQAIESGLSDPTAMTIATVDRNGCPDQRIVLLKQIDHQGFVFFTNKQSRKAQAIATNPQVSLHFPWYPLERQVKVRGTANPLSHEEVQAYFDSRPAESRLAAWASAQSQVIPSREHLIQQYETIKQRYENTHIPLPDFWGGYCIKPEEIEFWQGGEHRLHDRFRYTLTLTNEWTIERLSP